MFDRVSRDSTQLDALAEILDDDLEGESYEAFARITGQTKGAMLEFYAATADLPGQMVTRKIHAARDHEVVASVASIAGVESGALTENLIANYVVERDGRIVRLDQWEIEDLPLALNRFDQSTLKGTPAS